MKFILITYTIFLFATTSPIVVVNADRMVRFVFNNGIIPTLLAECNADDNSKIDAIFNQPLVRHTRNLRSNAADDSSSTPTTALSSPTDEHVHGQNDRELWPAYCRDNCAGYATGTCRASGCFGYRRNRQRELQSNATVTCDMAISSIHQQLDNLIVKKQVSSSCRVFLDKQKRTAQCYDDVIYGEVERFRLWKKSPSDTKPIPYDTIATGFIVCHNDHISIEAIVNPCVKYVESTMLLSTDSTLLYSNKEDHVPYTIFGNDNAIPIVKPSNPGIYIYTAVPDGFLYKQKSISFVVNKC